LHANRTKFYAVFIASLSIMRVRFEPCIASLGMFALTLLTFDGHACAGCSPPVYSVFPWSSVAQCAAGIWRCRRCCWIAGLMSTKWDRIRPLHCTFMSRVADMHGTAEAMFYPHPFPPFTIRTSRLWAQAYGLRRRARFHCETASGCGRAGDCKERGMANACIACLAVAQLPYVTFPLNPTWGFLPTPRLAHLAHTSTEISVATLLSTQADMTPLQVATKAVRHALEQQLVA